MIKRILILLILTSCSNNNSTTTNSKILSQSFNNDLSFNEFKRKLIEYTKITPYPNINE